MAMVLCCGHEGPSYMSKMMLNLPSSCVVTELFSGDVFCRKTSGTPRSTHSCTKCDPFKAAAIETSPLLAITPTR